MAEIPETLRIGQELGRELLVKERSARPDVVDLGRGLQDGGRALAIGALDGRDALAQGLPDFRPSGIAPVTLPKYTWTVVGSMLIR